MIWCKNTILRKISKKGGGKVVLKMLSIYLFTSKARVVGSHNILIALCDATTM
jgi:hypothetical protein